MAVLSQSNLSLNSMKNLSKQYIYIERERVTYSKLILRFIKMSGEQRTTMIILKDEEEEKKEEDEGERNNLPY